MTVSMENRASFLTPLTIVKKTFDSPEVGFRDMIVTVKWVFG